MSEDGSERHYCSHPGCRKSFSTRSSMNRHSTIHSGMYEPYYCSHPGCGKRFSTRGNMHRHGIIHTGGRRFECPHSSCGYAARAIKALEAHVRSVHTGDSLTNCPHCDRSVHDLQAHIFNMHNDQTASTPAQDKNMGAIQSASPFGQFRPIEHAASANVGARTIPSLSMVDSTDDSLFGLNFRTLPVPNGHPELDRSHVFCQECLFRPVNSGFCHMHQ